MVSSCSSRALEHDSVVMTCAQLLPGMRASPDQGLSPCLLHRQADCLPLSHQESPTFQCLVMGYNERHLEETRQIAMPMSVICVSVYLYLIHSAVFLKLTPHCKSAYFTSKKYELCFKKYCIKTHMQLKLCSINMIIQCFEARRNLEVTQAKDCRCFPQQSQCTTLGLPNFVWTAKRFCFALFCYVLHISLSDCTCTLSNLLQ